MRSRVVIRFADIGHIGYFPLPLVQVSRSCHRVKTTHQTQQDKLKTTWPSVGYTLRLAISWSISVYEASPHPLIVRSRRRQALGAMPMFAFSARRCRQYCITSHVSVLRSMNGLLELLGHTWLFVYSLFSRNMRNSECNHAQPPIGTHSAVPSATAFITK